MEVLKYSRYLCAGVIFVCMVTYFVFMYSPVYIDRIFDRVVVLDAIVTYPVKKCNPNKNVVLNFSVNNPLAKCYRSCSNSSLPYIDDKLNETERPIFFIESSCKSYNAGKIILNPRQACSIESAAKQNPQKQIYVLFLSSADVEREINSNNISDPIIQAILNHPNVAFKHIYYETYVNNTPIASLFAKGSIENSYHPIEHTSDILRLVTLWRYGGIYLDLDIISMKSLDELNENFGVYESADLVVNGVMGYKHDGIAHEFLKNCLEDTRDHYRGQSWGGNGPALITRNLLNLCNLTMGHELEKSSCGIKIYPRNTFFALGYWEWAKFFNETLADVAMQQINGSIAVHLWNKLNSNHTVYKNSTCLLMQIARKYCPDVYDASPELFG